MGCCPDEPLDTEALALTRLSRRHFLTGLAAVSAGMLAPGVWNDIARAASTSLPLLEGTDIEAPRQLDFSHTHTGETLRIVYCRGGAYVPEALVTVNHFLRDFRTGDQVSIDPHLLDVLFKLGLVTGTHSAFHVISAYRSPQTNAQLRARSSGVARNSQHLRGRAIDIRLTDVDTAALRDAAISLGRGGVGYYADSGFVHVDTGPVRTW